MASALVGPAAGPAARVLAAVARGALAALVRVPVAGGARPSVAFFSSVSFFSVSVLFYSKSL